MAANFVSGLALLMSLIGLVVIATSAKMSIVAVIACRVVNRAKLLTLGYLQLKLTRSRALLLQLSAH